MQLDDSELAERLKQLQEQICKAAAGLGLGDFEDTAAAGAVENIHKMRKLKETDAQMQKDDHAWATERWRIKLAAVARGDLKWCTFTCVRQ